MKITTDVDELILDIDTAMPLGLIMNELITNAFKYAFQGIESGELQISLKNKSDHLLLIVKDNGKGMPVEGDLGELESFGLKLVQSLAKQLKAEVEFVTEKGTGSTDLMTLTSFNCPKFISSGT